MIPAALPAAVDPAEPIPPARAPKGAPFATVIEAVPADAAADPKAETADKGDAADATATAQPGAPAMMADATALIAQLCPPPIVVASPAPDAGAPPQPCHSREPGNDAPVAVKATLHAGKPARQGGRTAASRLEPIADAASPPIEQPVAAPRSLTRPADATAPVDAPATAPPAYVAVTRQLDLAHDAQWLDRLAQDIARSADHNATLRFALSPEHLGRLTVDLAANADGTSVRLTAESEQAHRIVSDAQPRLVAEARAQGLRISETQVDLDQRPGGPPHPAPNGQPGQDRARPAVLWTESPRRRAGAAAHSVPAARDLYA